MSDAELDVTESYRKGLWLFNERHFFECHEILELEWRGVVGREKLFYQMLIQAAVAFVHWRTGNRRGVLSLQRTFDRLAEPFGAEIYLGLDVARLRADMRALIDPLRTHAELALTPFDALATPQLLLRGVEPLPCSDEELRHLARE